MINVFNSISGNQFLKFIMVGGVITLLHSLIYLLLISKSIDEQLANLTAFIISNICAYILQSKYTFSNQTSKKKLTMPFKFMINGIICYGLNVIWVLVATSYSTADKAVFGFILLTPLLSFFTQKYWVFKT